MARVLTFSDLHVDHDDNMRHMLSLSNLDFVEDTLVITGDVSDSLQKLRHVFEGLLRKFRDIFFVPGNHELWIRGEGFVDSVQKFNAVIDLCQQLGVNSAAKKIQVNGGALWLVPLFSWYRLPEDGEHTLFIEKPSENTKRFVWTDNQLCRWPASVKPADFFAKINRATLAGDYDAPVISFSHFLPRRELMFGLQTMADKYADGNTPIETHPLDPAPFFNFSRYAGDQRIEHQIRQLRSRIHLYGHQHRNRDRVIDDVRYISHCLGNPRERQFLSEQDLQPKCVWD